MRYIVKIYNTAGTIDTFESNSMDSLRHIKSHYGVACNVYSKKGNILSASRYNDRKGWYRCKVGKI